MCRILVFYPLSAVITLFCNILRDPLHQQARLDLELLSLAAGVIKSMPFRTVTHYEGLQVTAVEDAVLEAARLGQCAITKANSEDVRMEKY